VIKIHFNWDILNIKRQRGKVIAVILFAVAFGLVEAMVVVYLRQILATTTHDIFTTAGLLKEQGAKAILVSLGFIVFLRPEVLASWDTLHIEIIRETATIVMLLTLAYVASRFWRERLAYFLLSFGVWDIFYYIWMYYVIHWPRYLFDTDVLFLIPVPWVSPVIVPATISLGMIILSFVFLSVKSVNFK